MRDIGATFFLCFHGRLRATQYIICCFFLLFEQLLHAGKEIEEKSYFEPTRRINLTHVVDDCADLMLTPDGYYALLSTGRHNSTIQVYKVSYINGHPDLVSEPVSQPDENYWDLKELDAIGLSENGNYVYTVSSGFYNTTLNRNQDGFSDFESDFKYGTWINVFRLDLEHGHLTLLNDSIFIADSSSHCKLLTIGANRLYLTINNRLYSINTFPMVLSRKTSLNMGGGWASSLHYTTQAKNHSLYIGVARSHKGRDQYPASVISILDEMSKFSVQNQLSFGSASFQGFLNSVQLANDRKESTRLYILSSSKGNAEIWSIDVVNPDYKISLESNGEKALDIRINNAGTRLFYSSTETTLAAFKVTPQYALEKLEPAALDSGSHIKLALLPGDSHILSLLKNDSQPDALVLYRINEPMSDRTLLKVSVGVVGAATLAILATISIWLTCQWLKKRGARLGYQPLSDY